MNEPACWRRLPCALSLQIPVSCKRLDPSEPYTVILNSVPITRRLLRDFLGAVNLPAAMYAVGKYQECMLKDADTVAAMRRATEDREWQLLKLCHISILSHFRRDSAMRHEAVN